MHPVLLGMNYYFQADLVETAASTSLNPLYEPTFNIFTVVTIWNPYNVRFTPSMLNGGSLGSYTITNYLSDFQFTYSKNGSAVANFDLGDLLNTSDSGRAINLSIPNLSDNVELRPGEIRQFRLTPTGDLSPDFSDVAIVFDAATIGFNTADAFTPTDDFEVTMVIPTNRVQSGGGTRDGVRIDFNFSDTGTDGRTSTFQWLRFNFFDQEDPVNPYNDLVNAGTLFNDPEDLLIAGVEVAIRSADEPGSYTAGMLSNFNPRSPYPGGALIREYPGEQPPNYEAVVVRDKPLLFPAALDGVVPNQKVLGFWGESRESGTSFVSLFDVPLRPPQSMGQYQHASLALFGSQPAYALGNSMAHPHVDRSFAQDVPGGISQIDLSWFLNDAIWDDYFLSTLDPDAADPSSPQVERFIELDSRRAFSVSNANDYKEVAENLLIHGAFNVNSTSVQAWTAFLSALGSQGTSSGDLDFPFFRFSATDESPNTEWVGGPRNLTAAEIQSLAREMVDQVKERGPFLSLSDFVNRRLESGDAGRMGAIQEAIENANLNTLVASTTASLPNAPFPNNVIGKPAALAPGDISQADVLTTIAPKMSVRSDTFVIRAYCQSDDFDDGLWVEMVVQRLPTMNAVPYFGRDFDILHFRYLNEDEL